MHLYKRIKTFTSKIKSFLSKSNIDKIARDTKFVQRRSPKLHPIQFLLMMTTEMYGKRALSLVQMTDLLAKKGVEKMTPQGLAERLKNENTVEFLRQCLAHITQICPPSALKCLPTKGLIEPFGRVFLQDSTTISLDEHLTSVFKGSGGSSSTSSIKIDLTWEVLSGGIETINITEGTSNDRTLSDQILDSICPWDLVIRDLGYFVSSTFRKIIEKGAFFLSRLPLSINVYTKSGELIKDLPRHMERLFPGKDVVELDVLIGKKEQLPVRLIVYRVPSRFLKKKQKKAKRKVVKNGSTPTTTHENWEKYVWLITNVPPSTWAKEEVGTVYKLRWEIELIFKNWKSNLKIDIMKGRTKNRILCLILSRLILIYVTNYYCASLRNYIHQKKQREISQHKFLNWLLLYERILSLWDPDRIIRELCKIIKTNSVLSMCKQKRNRKTTLEKLQESVPFMEASM